MDTSKDHVMISFHVPDDMDILGSLGKITLAHSHLDHILKMTIKTLSGVSVKQAVDATARDGSAALRRRIEKLAKQQLGEGKAFIQLQALMQRCKSATSRRNDLVHNIWARELDGEPLVRTEDHEWKPIPKLDELNTLFLEVEALTKELNQERLDGFLSEALQRRGSMQKNKDKYV